MSQDLFAAFGSVVEHALHRSGQQRPVQKVSVFDDIDQPSQHPQKDAADDDWGEFEGSSTEQQDVFGSFGNLTIQDSESSTTPTVRRHQDNPSVNISTLNTRKEPRDPDILFDASEDLPSEDEDFGDFEGTVPTATQDFTSSTEANLLGLEDNNLPRVQPSTLQKPQNEAFGSLLDLDEMQNPVQNPEAVEAARKTEKPSNKHTTMKDEPSFVQQVNTQKSPPSTSVPTLNRQTTVSEISTNDDDEPWDDFTSWEANIESTTATNPPKLPFSIPTPKSPPPEPANPQPPTNVPPPAILLSLFPPLLTSLSTSFFQPLSSLQPSTRSTVYTNPVAITYLKSYLALATVCARLLAGRKLRWKRDTLLSQAMRIGPAAGGSAGRGMKVTSVDRTEVQREEREVADVVRAWQGEVGKLRGAVAEIRKGAIGTEREGMLEGLRVPEIKEEMVVRSIGVGEGGVKSVRPCALCGLMRDERVGKVDGEVFDGFDEWWVESMNMHRSEFSGNLNVEQFD
jgi:hypothetical protein